MSQPGVRPAGSALNLLIRQFSQPLACLRELVQNSIDAGSNQVEVSLLELEDGRVCLSVRDTGEGMTRHIIETQLTRLFASAKDGDLTKVGKFGIGFVSVFSLNPLAVVVDTGREGQSWRILFHPDRSYELLCLPHPVEGTLVQIYLPRGSTHLEQKLTRVQETLDYWCKHCRAQILLNGRSLSKPFSLGFQHEIYHEVPGTRMCLALTTEAENFAGFYNQGLTLLEGNCSPLPYLSLKVDSRYFEHTLTRDNVIENQDYAKAILLIRQTVASQLAPQLYARLRAGSPEWPLLDSLLALQIDLEQAPLFLDLNGQAWSLGQLRQARIFHQARSDQLTAALHNPDQGRIVLASGPGLDWLRRQNLDCPEAQTVWGLCRPAQQPALDKLMASCQAQLKQWKQGQLRPVRWFGSQKQPLLHPAAQVGLVEWNSHAPDGIVLLNLDHPFCEKLQQIQSWSPPLAQQFLLQQYLLLLPESSRLEWGARLSQAVVKRL